MRHEAQVLLRDELEARGVMFQTTVDSEVILNLLAQPTPVGEENNLVHTVRRIEGAYGDRNLVVTCPPVTAYATADA